MVQVQVGKLLGLGNPEKFHGSINLHGQQGPSPGHLKRFPQSEVDSHAAHPASRRCCAQQRSLTKRLIATDSRRSAEVEGTKRGIGVGNVNP